MAAGFAVIQSAEVQRERAGIEAKDGLLRKLDQLMDSVEQEAEDQAYFLALESIRSSPWDGGGPEAEFEARFARYIESTFSDGRRKVGEHEITLGNWSVVLGQRQMQVWDVGPALETSKEKVGDKDGETNVKVPDAALGGKIGVQPSTPMYWLDGLIECRIERNGTDAYLSRNLRIDRPLPGLRPFAMERFRALEESSEGTSSEVARMLKYALTTLAQYRVLQGEVDHADVLSRRDVELATNLCVVLEQYRHFRTADPGAVGMFDAEAYDDYSPRWSDIGPGQLPASNRSLANLMAAYATTGTIDPADVIALFTCIDSEPVHVSEILAQAFHALLDQMILKYTDYLSFPDGLGDKFGNAKVGFINRLLGYAGMDETVGISQNGGICVSNGKLTADGKLRVTQPASRSWGEWYLDEWEGTSGTGSDWCVGPYLHNKDNETGHYDDDTDRYLYRRLEFQNPYRTSYDDDTVIEGYNEFFCDGVADNYQLWLKFSASVDITDPDDKAFILIQPDNGGIDWDGWTVLREFNHETPAWYNDTISLSAYRGLNVWFAVRMVSDGDDSSVGVNFSRLKTSSVFNGTQVGDLDFEKGVSTSNYYLDLGNKLKKETFGKLSDLAGWVRNSSRELTNKLFRSVAQKAADVVTGLLFGNTPEPRLFPDPADQRTMLCEMKQAAVRHVKNGIQKLKDELKDGDIFEQYVANATASFKGIMARVLGPVKDIIDGKLAGVAEWVDDAKERLKNGLGWLAGGIDGIVNAVADLLGLGSYWDTAKLAISDIVDSATGYWNSFKLGITNALTTVRNKASGLVDWLGGAAWSGAEAALDKMGGQLVRLACRMLDGVEGFLLAGMHSIMEGGRVANVPYFLPVHAADADGPIPFELWEGSRLVARAKGGTARAGFAIDQKPNYLYAASVGSLSAVRPDQAGGSLLVFMPTPEGLHYTDPEKFEQRPFETRWDVSVAAELDVSIETDGVKDAMGPGPLNGTWSINVSIPIVVYSGWALSGVDYDASRSVYDDIKGFLDKVWEKVLGGVKIILDGLHKLAGLFKKIVETLVKLAAKITKFINDLIQMLGDALKKLVERVLDKLMESWVVREIIEAVDAAGKRLEFSAFGLRLGLEADLDAMNDAGGTVLKIGVGASISSRDLNFDFSVIKGEGNFTNCSYFAVAEGVLGLKSADVNFVIDPARAQGEHVFQLSAEGGKWGMEMVAPEAEEYRMLEYSLESMGWAPTIPIPPLGLEATINAGFLMKYAPPEGDAYDFRALILGMLKESFAETWEEMKDSLALSLDYLKQFISALVNRFIDKVLAFIEEVVYEVHLFLDVAIGTIGSSLGGGAGGGVRVSFVMDGHAVAEILRWVVESIKTLLSKLLTPWNALKGPSLQDDLRAHMSLRIEGYFEAGLSERLGKAMPGAPAKVELHIVGWPNLPALGVLFKKDWGDWWIEFGVLMADFPPSAAEQTFGTSGDAKNTVDIWLLRGRVYEV